ncbi:MAG: hypothetical protein U5K30_02030 [Acidimicrobiales bacterium]|nr:hypothetical protein [Acidimicrobiales bacterium]
MRGPQAEELVDEVRQGRPAVDVLDPSLAILSGEFERSSRATEQAHERERGDLERSRRRSGVRRARLYDRLERGERRFLCR